MVDKLLLQSKEHPTTEPIMSINKIYQRQRARFVECGKEVIRLGHTKQWFLDAVNHFAKEDAAPYTTATLSPGDWVKAAEEALHIAKQDAANYEAERQPEPEGFPDDGYEEWDAPSSEDEWRAWARYKESQYENGHEYDERW